MPTVEWVPYKDGLPEVTDADLDQLEAARGVKLPAAYRALADATLARAAILLERAPRSAGHWLAVAEAAEHGPLQVAVTTVPGDEELLAAARDYLAPLQAAKIDTLILGCTHYPLLTGVLSYVLGDTVTLVSSADECAKAAYARLTALDLLHAEPREATHRFLTTGNPERFEGIGRRLIGNLVADVEQFVA